MAVVTVTAFQIGGFQFTGFQEAGGLAGGGDFPWFWFEMVARARAKRVIAEKKKRKQEEEELEVAFAQEMTTMRFVLVEPKPAAPQPRALLKLLTRRPLIDEALELAEFREFMAFAELAHAALAKRKPRKIATAKPAHENPIMVAAGDKLEAILTAFLAAQAPKIAHQIEQLKARMWKLAKEYNEDEPRDEHGRWTSGGDDLKDETKWHAGERYGTSKYQPKSGGTWIDYINTGDRTSIEFMNTPEGQQGQGQARATLESFLSQMDAHGRTTELDVEHFSAHPNDKELRAFYESVGFKAASDYRQSHHMVRDPKASKLFKAQMSDDEIAALNAVVAGLDFTGWATLAGDVDDIIGEVTKDGAYQALKLAGLDVTADKDVFNMVNEDALEYAEKRSAEMVGMRRLKSGKLIPNPDAEWQITEGTRDLIRGSVGEALQEGWSTDTLAGKLVQSAAFSPERASTIARTELIRANNTGTLNGFKSSGVVALKEWTTFDPCEICEANEEQGPIGLDDTFDSGDDAPPAHPNCKCALVGYTVDETQPEAEEE